MQQLYDLTLNTVISAFEALSQQVQAPQVVRINDGYGYRYAEQSLHQAIIQKLARLLTVLQSMSILNEAGFLQEQASLQRMHDEFSEDIKFLSFAVIFDDFTERHKQYLEYFYEEEFDIGLSAIKSSQKRGMVPRKKIQAYLSKDSGTGYDPSSTQEISRTITKGYSSYVHGASPHIMELYYGNPPKFQLSGGQDSPYIEDHTDDLLNYYYRTILGFSFAAKSFGDEELNYKLYVFSVEFAKASGKESQLRETQ